MFCVYCGKEIDDDLLYCPFCGKKVDLDDEPEPIEEPEDVEEQEPSEEPEPVIKSSTDEEEEDWAEREQPEPPKAGSRKTVLIIIILAAVAALVVGLLIFTGSHKDAPAPQKPVAEEPVPENMASDVQEDAVVSDVLDQDVNKNIHIVSWDLDFSNSSNKNDDGTMSYDIIMLVTNDSGHDLSGMAFKVKNRDGDKVENKNDRCESDAPFYAEGYVPDRQTGVMVSRFTVTKDEYNKENPKKSGKRLRIKDAKITQAYVFRGEDGYKQPTGKIIGPDKAYADSEYYTAVINNENATPVHEGATIVAVKRNDENYMRITVSSAKGEIDREIPAEMSEAEIKDAFEDPGLDEWPAEDYEVYVIDNEYADGSHYYDSYREQYFK